MNVSRRNIRLWTAGAAVSLAGALSLAAVPAHASTTRSAAPEGIGSLTVIVSCQSLFTGIAECSASVSGGTAPYSYAWSDGEDTSFISFDCISGDTVTASVDVFDSTALNTGDGSGSTVCS